MMLGLFNNNHLPHREGATHQQHTMKRPCTPPQTNFHDEQTSTINLHVERRPDR